MMVALLYNHQRKSLVESPRAAPPKRHRPGREQRARLAARTVHQTSSNYNKSKRRHLSRRGKFWVLGLHVGFPCNWHKSFPREGIVSRFKISTQSVSPLQFSLGSWSIISTNKKVSYGEKCSDDSYGGYDQLSVWEIVYKYCYKYVMLTSHFSRNLAIGLWRPWDNEHFVVTANSTIDKVVV